MTTRLFPKLEEVSAPGLDTESAAFYLGKRPQTLRIWASKDAGPIKPVRIGARLSWPTDEVRRVATEGGEVAPIPRRKEGEQ